MNRMIIDVLYRLLRPYWRDKDYVTALVVYFRSPMFPIHRKPYSNVSCLLSRPEVSIRKCSEGNG